MIRLKSSTIHDSSYKQFQGNFFEPLVIMDRNVRDIEDFLVSNCLLYTIPTIPVYRSMEDGSFVIFFNVNQMQVSFARCHFLVYSSLLHKR
jgi:hypothetical protein